MSTTHVIPLKRRMSGKTDYRRRYRLLLSGRLRIVIRRSNSRYIVQLVQYDGQDRTLLSVDSRMLGEFGWGCSTRNIPAAYLTGYLFGKRLLVTKGAKSKEAIVDFGVYSVQKGGGTFAIVKGILDSGVGLDVDETTFPSDERLSGIHISSFAKNARDAQFGKIKPATVEISEQFKNVKKSIDDQVK